MRKLLGFTLTSALSVGAYALTAHFKRTNTEQQAGKFGEEQPQSNVVWISYDPTEEEVPLFEEGDEVHAKNPYTHAVWGDPTSDFQNPAVYEIGAVSFDDYENTFRYQLRFTDGEEEVVPDLWYAEEWLIAKEFPRMLREGSAEYEEEANGMTDKVIKEASRLFEIDHYLKALQDAKESGDKKTYAEAEAELKRLTTEGADE